MERRFDDDIQIEDNELISLVMCQVGGKPVILFSSPVPLRDVTTSITLSSKWTFSGVYPRAACASENASRTIAWAHDVAPRTKNNMLTMAGTGLRVSSLFWEASSDATCRMPLSEGDAFDPRASRMTLSNSLLLGFEECQTYLEQQLRLLSLSDTAATDFMQYWVPSFTEIAEKGQKIALRFVPQIELDAEALLEVTPKPDVLIRIFLLFKGVRTEDWNDWQGVTEQSFDWQRVVGIKDTSPNPELFEVREWGGMQVF